MVILDDLLGELFEDAEDRLAALQPDYVLDSLSKMRLVALLDDRRPGFLDRNLDALVELPSLRGVLALFEGDE